MANEVKFFEIIGNNSKELGEFYSKVFDWNILPPAGTIEYSLMDTKGENGVMGAVGSPFINNESWITIYVTVDSIDEIMKKVVQNGGKVKVPKFTTDTGFTLAYIEDRNGNIIGLTEK